MKKIILVLGMIFLLSGCMESIKWGSFEYMAICEDQKIEGLEVELADGTKIKIKGKASEANTADTMNAVTNLINSVK